MGLFNSVSFTCPHCEAEQEEQFKPGNMYRWRFPEDVESMPPSYVQYFQKKNWTCYRCDNEFSTNVDIIRVVRNARVSPIPRGK